MHVWVNSGGERAVIWRRAITDTEDVIVTNDDTQTGGFGITQRRHRNENGNVRNVYISQTLSSSPFF